MSALPQELQCMDILDKLFSREITRRTGAHAVSIYVESAANTRKRMRKIGSRAVKTTYRTKITTKREEHSFLYRLNLRFPWGKLVLACLIGVVAIVDLCDLTISRVYDPNDRIRIAPMSKHLRATTRDLEGKKLVVLTFDDGPSAASTPALLDTLFEKDVLATFFTLGNMARGNPDLVKRIESEHHEVASHTMYHQNLIAIPPASAQADINESKNIINDNLGHPPLYTRPPYGNLNGSVISFIDTPIILWSVDSEDWKHKDTGAIVSTVISEIHDGAIILMHDIYPSTVEALPTLIDTIRADGYEFATISEIAAKRKIDLTPGTIYYNFLP